MSVYSYLVNAPWHVSRWYLSEARQSGDESIVTPHYHTVRIITIHVCIHGHSGYSCGPKMENQISPSKPQLRNTTCFGHPSRSNKNLASESRTKKKKMDIERRRNNKLVLEIFLYKCVFHPRECQLKRGLGWRASARYKHFSALS